MERALEPVFMAGADQPGHQRFQGEEAHRVAGLHGLDPEGDGQVGLPHAGWAEQDDIVRALHEAEARQLAEHLAIDRRLEVEVELLEALQPGEARQLQPALDAALVPAPPFGFERVGEKPLVVDIALGRLLTDAVELGEEVIHLHPLEEGFVSSMSPPPRTPPAGDARR